MNCLSIFNKALKTKKIENKLKEKEGEPTWWANRPTTVAAQPGKASPAHQGQHCLLPPARRRSSCVPDGRRAALAPPCLRAPPRLPGRHGDAPTPLDTSLLPLALSLSSDRHGRRCRALAAVKLAATVLPSPPRCAKELLRRPLHRLRQAARADVPRLTVPDPFFLLGHRRSISPPRPILASSELAVCTVATAVSLSLEPPSPLFRFHAVAPTSLTTKAVVRHGR